MDAFGDPGVWMIRADCESLIEPFCVSGGDLPAFSCPCSNEPAGGGLGCDNFSACSCNPKSGTLEGSGFPEVGAGDTLDLIVTGMNESSTTIFFGGTATVATAVSGAGLRCVGGTVKRLYTASLAQVSGGAAASSGATPSGVSVSDRSAALNSTITPGQTRYYYNSYRDPMAAVPCGFSTSTINTTNALSIGWQ